MATTASRIEKAPAQLWVHSQAAHSNCDASKSVVLCVRAMLQQNIVKNSKEEHVSLNNNVKETHPMVGDASAIIAEAKRGSEGREEGGGGPRRKKISFKIRKSSSVCRRKEGKSVNVVQELAKRYNDLEEMREDSTCNGDKKTRNVTNPNPKRRSVKDGHKRLLGHEDKVHSVQEAIALFEQKCNTTINSTEKPKIPEKTFDVDTIVMRNVEKRMRLRQKISYIMSLKQETHNAQRNNTIVNLCKKNSILTDNNAAKNGNRDLKNDTADKCSDGSNLNSDSEKSNGVSCPSEDNPHALISHGDRTQQQQQSTKAVLEGEMDAVAVRDVCDDTETEVLQIVSLPMGTLKKCESNYECKKFGLYTSTKVLRTSTTRLSLVKPPIEERIKEQNASPAKDVEEKTENQKDIDEYYDLVQPQDDSKPIEPNYECDNAQDVPPLPPRIKVSRNYEIVPKRINEKDIDDYEIPQTFDESSENIYESLNRCSITSTAIRNETDSRILRKQTEPLPPRPSSSTSTINSNDDGSNYYESIYSKRDDNYETIDDDSAHLGNECKRNSLSVQSTQSDQQTNSIYGRSITSWAEEILDTYIGGGSIISLDSGSACDSNTASSRSKTVSELSGSSDDWVDISDPENDPTVCDRAKCNQCNALRQQKSQKGNKKQPNWSQQMRDQWNKVYNSTQQGDTDSENHYEIMFNGNASHTHETIEKNDEDEEDFDSFDSDCESENSFAKNDSGVDMGNAQLPEPPSGQTYAFTRFAASASKNVMKRIRSNWSLRKSDISKSLSKITNRKSRSDLDVIDNENGLTTDPVNKVPENDKQKARGFLNKFKRSMSMSGEYKDAFADRSKSTFYITEADNILQKNQAVNGVDKSDPSTSNKKIACGGNKQKSNLVRPQMPPPPTPGPKLRSESWYSECGVFKSELEHAPPRPNSFWYAEVGLYESGSPPSTISSKEENSEENKNYQGCSIKSYDSSETKRDEAFNSLQGDIQLRLQDEPLYQFYDAAVLDSVYSICQSSQGDSDYEDIEKEKRTSRPTAMELVSPHPNNVSVARTLWCEIPEVIQSTVLSTLNPHQKKLQEAKFEMLTSEASYLNSLNVLVNHFVRQLQGSDLLSASEKEVLCGKIIPVKECSEKLLLDLEKCWQENILLHGVCDIVKRHAEESFSVYISYCANQIVLDQTLKRLKEKPLFVEFLRQLESNSICQLLTLYSFLMLPMQRITRWPLLLDAILKRLQSQDNEYQSCQYALLTLNKIVSQCNESARNMERLTEMKKVASQIEFPKGMTPIAIANEHRWLVRSGALTQMISRADDSKLTFGKRFNKVPLHLFLFNDIFIVAKSKGDDIFVVQHYCSRSFVEINSDNLASLPTKDTQTRHLIFLTILENHNEKTVEMLLNCASESDKERWVEALSPPKSENPDETLYECWDCPQVTAIHNYSANQPDELPLNRGDVINVTRKMVDGWYHGERIRDGEIGWFPANYTIEVANPHVRARNLKQRYRLLAFSENYLKSK